MIDVSVVIPTRNRSRLLAGAIRSSLLQWGVELEMIVVDDGSDDDSAEVVASFDDARLRYIRRQRSEGVSAARNLGIAESRGEWVAFLDDDDLWAPQKIHDQLITARAHDRGWAYCGSVNVDAAGNVRGGAPPLSPERLVELLPRWNPMPGGCSNAMVRADLLEQVGPFDPAFGILADWDMWLRVSRVAGPPACVARPLVAYRVHAANMSLDVPEMFRELELMQRRHGPSVDRAGFARHMARQALRSGGRAQALKMFALAAVSGPATRIPTEMPKDLRLLANHALEGTRRRMGRPPSRRALRRQEAARRTDPNRDWKAAAEAWLARLDGPTALDVGRGDQ